MITLLATLQYYYIDLNKRICKILYYFNKFINILNKKINGALRFSSPAIMKFLSTPQLTINGDNADLIGSHGIFRQSPSYRFYVIQSFYGSRTVRDNILGFITMI